MHSIRFGALYFYDRYIHLSFESMCRAREGLPGSFMCYIEWMARMVVEARLYVVNTDSNM